MIKLLIFDLDGTLADTGRDIADAINYALQPVGGKTYSVEETKTMVGSGLSKLLESLIPETIPPFSPPRIRRSAGEKEESTRGLVKGGAENAKELVISRFLEFYSEHLLDNTKAYPRVKETLSQLGGYKKAVLSNKREFYSKRILEGLGLLEYFDIVLGSDSVRKKKPSPVPILDLLEKRNVLKDEAVIIGDSNYDVDAGKAAGVEVIAVTYGFRTIEFLKGADYIVDSFEYLLNILPEINKA